jgi:hypothetical protein
MAPSTNGRMRSIKFAARTNSLWMTEGEREILDSPEYILITVKEYQSTHLLMSGMWI